MSRENSRIEEQHIKRSILNYSSEEKRFYRASIRKFRKSHVLYVILLSSIALLQVISIAFFTKGFSFCRSPIRHTAQYSPEYSEVKKFDKAVVLLVDALRFDFVVPINELDPIYNENYHNNIDIISELLNQNDNSTKNESKKDRVQKSSSLLFKFLAEPPTTTFHRLKGITTGLLPSFLDGIMKLNDRVVEDDSIIKQLFLRNKTIYFSGDDTWSRMFEPYLSPKSVPLESYNIWDLNTVDDGVFKFFNEHLTSKNTSNREWDILIGHIVGIDHAATKYGPNHITVKQKQIQINEFIKQIVKSLDDQTLLIVMGDHGMDITGNHGGKSSGELESSLFLYSKKSSVWKQEHSLHENNNDFYKKINQIDIVPTFSLLFGIPIPYNNLGWPINEISLSDEENNIHMKLALEQIRKYQLDSDIIQDKKDNNTLNTLYEQAKLDINKTHAFYEAVLSAFKSNWKSFDYLSIGTGIFLLLVSVTLLIIITKLIPSIVVNQMVTEFVQNILICTLITNICICIIFFYFGYFGFIKNIFWCISLATAIGIIIGCFRAILHRYNIKWVLAKFFSDFSDYWSMVGVIFLFIHAGLFMSNSLTIWEDRVVHHLIITFGFLALYEFIFIPNRQSTTALATAVISEQQGTLSGVSPSLANSFSLPMTRFARLLGTYHSIVLLLCTRSVSTITSCREGQLDYCVPTFTTEINYSWGCTAVFIVVLILLPMSIKGYYNLLSSYQAAAPIWIDYLLKLFLYFDIIYWVAIVIETKYDVTFINFTLINVTIARIIICFTFVVCNLAWMVGPLCIKLNVENADMRSQQTTIIGYSNIYGAPYFLLVINAFMSILFFNKPLAQISLALMCNQILSIMEIIDLLNIKENIIGPIVLSLLSYQQFFNTGHQFTLSSIQWDTGFILSDTVNFPFTEISIMINTFGPFIIVALSIVLLTLWSQPPDILKPQTLLGRLVANCGILVTYNAVLCLSSFIWLTYFLQHPMVWNIFYPRFIYASIILLITQFVVIFATIGFASGKLIGHINNIFWK
ncbi:hypothetical protein TPHA_0K02180 [Tetrapisispora phaffii CBS 4417]|uniref:Uncharacterized protein n=1 Tax=Tetrapisispora phaffii (strain ATCC 24235 / CBS 4417 / NBRC 1672 / NRRL Y-8282 / UCD 70-5) TaxID=1071381 RepID=G8BZM1_TETPH|nr:hypothetical protein TPHA_0K02180 [Tetrapisispora phaffii CBS 4417]CCE65349.1 hypothetical protein TPHA_0K02180 [Tetrapisispora phaffii CBS 4417]